MTPESRVSADLQAWLGALPGVLVERRNVGTARAATGAVVRFGTPGEADLRVTARIPAAWGGGVLALGIEVKAAHGRQSDAQRRWQAVWQSCGGVYVLARSRNDVRAAVPWLAELADRTEETLAAGAAQKKNATGEEICLTRQRAGGTLSVLAAHGPRRSPLRG